MKKTFIVLVVIFSCKSMTYNEQVADKKESINVGYFDYNIVNDNYNVEVKNSDKLTHVKFNRTEDSLKMVFKISPSFSEVFKNLDFKSLESVTMDIRKKESINYKLERLVVEYSNDIKLVITDFTDSQFMLDISKYNFDFELCVNCKTGIYFTLYDKKEVSK